MTHGSSTCTTPVWSRWGGDEAANLPYPIPDKKAGKGKADKE